MAEAIFDIEAPTEVLAAIIERATAEGVVSSAPTPATPTTGPLHAPINGAELKEGLEVAILIFKTGAAAAAFFGALHTLLDKFGSQTAVRATSRKTRHTTVVNAKTRQVSIEE